MASSKEKACAGARWKRQQRENNLRLLSWGGGSGGTRETRARWQTASETGTCEGAQRHERRRPVKAMAGQPKGHVQSRSVTAAGRAAAAPSVVRLSVLGTLGVPVDGKEHKEVPRGRADSPRAIKPIKYVFPHPAEGRVRGFSSLPLMNGEWQTEAGASSKGSFPPSGGP